jgi:hexosaminidase
VRTVCFIHVPNALTIVRFPCSSCYTQDNETQASLASSNKTFLQALDTFTQANHAALRSVGKSAVVWEGVSSAPVVPIHD